MSLINSGIIYEIAYPHFTIEDYTSSVSVYSGDTARIYYTIINDGNADGVVEARIVGPGGDVIASKQHTLSPGVGVSGYLEFTPSSSGVYVLQAYNTSTSTIDDSKNINVDVKSRSTGRRLNIIPLVLLFASLVFTSKKK